MRQQAVNNQTVVETLRPVKVVNNSNPQPAYVGQNYGSRSNVSHSSTGSGRNAHVVNNSIVQKHGSLYAMEGTAHQAHINSMDDTAVRRSMSNSRGHANGTFRVSTSMSANPASRLRGGTGTVA